MIEYSKIAGVHLEISSRCNAACPDCPRNLRGYDIEGQDFELHDMTLSEFQTIFRPEFLQQIKSFLINGNYGDFVTCRDGLKIVQYISECNPQLPIEISTNASGQPKIWKELGLLPNLHVVFRIDGLEDTNHIYRQYTDFNLIMKNAANYISAGGCATWAFNRFDYNEHQIELARDLAASMGFQDFQVIDVGRTNMSVFDRQGNFLRYIGHPDNPETDIQVLLFARKSGADTQAYREYYPTIVSKPIDCQAKGAQSIYVQSNGQVYPCCWTGAAPDTNFVRGGNEQIRAVCKDNNALVVGLERAIEWFAELEKTWSIPTVAQGRSVICNETCGRNINTG